MLVAGEEAHRGVARRMRREPTPAERVLWLALRGRRFLAWKFRRQVPIGPFVADFPCFEARLVIEVDGGHHAENARDVERDRWFAENGFRVLRLWNHEVLKARETALDAIFAALSQAGVEGGQGRGASSASRAPSSAPSGPLLPRGEKGGCEARARASATVSEHDAFDASRSNERRSPSLLPSREKVAAQRPDERAGAAQGPITAQRPDATNEPTSEEEAP